VTISKAVHRPPNRGNSMTAVRIPLSQAIGITEDMAKHEVNEMLVRAAARDMGG